MSEELVEELNEEITKRKKKDVDTLIEVRHTEGKGIQGDLKAQLEAEKKRREEAENIIAIEAERTFETERDNLLKNIPSERREQVKTFISDDPDRLAQIRGSLILQGQIEDDSDEENEPVPKGRATLPDSMLPPEQRGQVRSPTYQNETIQKYSDLYAIIRDPKTSEKEKSEAESILDDTFNEIGRGLRSRPKNNPYMLPTGVVSHCLKCGMVSEIDLSKNPCPYCGFDFSKDKLPRNPKFEPR